MKIISLRDNQLGYFKGFDPFELLERGDVKPGIRLGAVCESEDGDIPAGILLGTKREDALIILWIFTEGSLRRLGFAEKLLSVIFQYAKKTGTARVDAVFPEGYGRSFVCGRENGRRFFASHGFVRLDKKIMTAAADDYDRVTAYNGPSLEDEGLALYELFDGIPPEEYPAFAKKEDEKNELAADTGTIHKPLEIREERLRRFALLPFFRSPVKRHADPQNEQGLSYGSIGELSLMEFRDSIEACEKKGHTGFLKSLLETPPDYFDMKTSSYMKKDGNIEGLFLTHYDEAEQCIYVELLFVSGNDHTNAVTGLLRFAIVAALKNYRPETKVILPYDERLQRPLIKKLLD